LVVLFFKPIKIDPFLLSLEDIQVNCGNGRESIPRDSTREIMEGLVIEIKEAHFSTLPRERRPPVLQ
jgi:hypothetical protein